MGGLDRSRRCIELRIEIAFIMKIRFVIVELLLLLLL